MRISRDLYRKILSTKHPNALNLWVEEIMEKPLSEQTKHKYITWGIQFVERYGENIPYRLDKPETYQAYVKDLLAAGYSLGTIQARLSVIENLANFMAKRYGYWALTGLQKFCPTEAPKRRTELLSPKDIERLYAAAKTLKEKVTLRLCVELRLSAGQIARLKRTENGYEIDGKALEVPQDLAELLSQLEPNAEGFVFVAPDGFHWTGQRVRVILHRLTERAGLKKRVTPRAIRYTLAATDIAKGTDPTRAAQTIGLHSPKSAKRLSKLSKELPQKTNPLEALKGVVVWVFTKLATLFTQSH